MMNNIIQWFIKNPIAANLLMLALLIGGWTGMGAIKKEVFPSPDINFISVNMSYPGAAPTEVEQQIVIRIEEAIAGLPGVFQLTSESRQGSGSVTVEVIDGYNVKDVLSNVKGRVDAINTFPPSAERPIISQVLFRDTLLWFAISGDADKNYMKQLAYQIRDEMPLLEGVSEVEIQGLVLDEVAIEISDENLRRYNLTFSEVAAAIRRSSMNVPAGTIKSEQGNIQIQTRTQAYNGQDFAQVVVRSNTDGSQLYLSDIADIKDGFSEQEMDFIIGTKAGLNFNVLIGEELQLFKGTENALAYLDEFKKTLPAGLTLTVNDVRKEIFDGRFNLLKDNALSGLVLVFIILMLFLRPKLAIWVVIGIVTAFAGAILFLPFAGISLNMLSMFAFLMVLGIVVDDAIIVGESVYKQQQDGLKGHKSAEQGAKNVLSPVVLAVLSTIIFFMPMLDVPSQVEPFTVPIFFVVCFCLLFSLAESLLILPSHLAHMKPEQPSRFAILRKLEAIRHKFSDAMQNFSAGTYKNTLTVLLKYKGSTVLAFFLVFFMSVSMFVADWLKVAFFPNIPAPFIQINATYPDGSPYRYSTDLALYMKKHANSLNSDKDLLAKNEGQPFIREVNTNTNSNNVNLFVGLTPSEERTIATEVIQQKLQELIGPLPELQSYSLQGSFGNTGSDIRLNLSMSNNIIATQQLAVDDIKRTLTAYDGIMNVRSNLDTGRLEVELDVKDYAQTLGIDAQDIATQVRQAFYGEEVQRIPRSKEDVRVMLRFPEDQRRSLDTLDDMRIRTAQGIEVPLEAVANIKLVPGSSAIRRTDRVRNITITAETAEGVDGGQIVNQMLTSYDEQWKKQYLGFELSADGNLRAQAEFGDTFAKDFLLAFLVAFSLFAISFKSMFEPLLVLIAVPFGFMGAVFGHLIGGYELSMFSFMGFLACSGVVVNDNLVLLERIKQLRKKGYSAFDAALHGGVDRFRPIVLTSLTTFVGLVPIMFETSTQALFLIPMVIALSFGVLFSSVVTLLMIPCAYLGGYSFGVRIKHLYKTMFNRVSLTDDKAVLIKDNMN